MTLFLILQVFWVTCVIIDNTMQQNLGVSCPWEKGFCAYCSMSRTAQKHQGEKEKMLLSILSRFSYFLPTEHLYPTIKQVKAGPNAARGALSEAEFPKELIGMSIMSVRPRVKKLWPKNCTPMPTKCRKSARHGIVFRRQF